MVAFHPDRDVQDAMGNNFMARDRVEDIVQQAFLATGVQAARERTRQQLARLDGRRRVA